MILFRSGFFYHYIYRGILPYAHSCHSPYIHIHPKSGYNHPDSCFLSGYGVVSSCHGRYSNAHLQRANTSCYNIFDSFFISTLLPFFMVLKLDTADGLMFFQIPKILFVAVTVVCHYFLQFFSKRFSIYDNKDYRSYPVEDEWQRSFSGAFRSAATEDKSVI